jgi:transcriptional regulator with XRE-family HTH domain
MDDPHTPETAQQTPEARFGAVLRELREGAGLTLRALGEQLHRSYSTISDFEKGVRLPAVDVVEHYEAFFELPRGTLVAQRERARAQRLELPLDGTVDEHALDVGPQHTGPPPFEPADADVFTRGGENSVDAVRERQAVAPSEPEADFGAVLRELRERAGLTLRALGGELHRSYSTISDFENGVRLPAVDVVEHYEEYFKLPRGTLVAQRERARAQRLESPRDGTVDEHLGDVACPYKGLQPFEATDADLFFGRENQVEAVRERLAVARFVAVVGASGSGKSSFLRAGLLAAITQQTTSGPRPSIALLTPGEHPLDALTTAVSAATDGTARVLADELRADPTTLGRVARRVSEGGLVIAVDQFEELFTQCDDDTERGCFVDALLAAWRDLASPVTVIVALRADFYDRVIAYPPLAAAVVAHQTPIGPLTAVQLRRAIELPAAHAGLTLQPGLTDTILEDLAGEPGALPLLSHALLETWKRRRRLMLTIGAYREAGGVRGAIAQTAEQTLQRLPETDQAIARQIFLALTDITERAEPTRRRIDRDELTSRIEPAQTDRVLAILAAARLVTIDEHTVTVAHEALIRHWPRLRNWIETDRASLQVHRRLTAAAREWDTMHREPAALYRGARLATANEWATEHPTNLNALEHEFLTKSQAAERRTIRRLRALATGLAAVGMIVAGLALVALNQRNDAEHKRADAQRETAKATSLALAASSVEPLKTRPDVSLALAFEAYRTAPGPEASSAVIRALLAARSSPMRGVLTTNGRLSTVAFSPGAKMLATATDSDGTVRLWDPATRKQLGRITGPTDLVYAVAFSHDGKALAIAGGDGTVRLWDPATHEPLGRLIAPIDRLTALIGRPPPITAMAFSHDGKTLVTASYDGTVRLWDLATHQPLGRLPGHIDVGNAVAFSPDGKTLATGEGFHGTVRLWDPAKRKPLRRLADHTEPMDTEGLDAVAFSPDGKTLAIAGGDGTVRLWDPATRKPLSPLPGPFGPIDAIAFSPDGKTLAIAGGGGTVRLWDLTTRKPLGPLPGPLGAVIAVAFSPDGRTLATVSSSKAVRIWKDVLWHNLSELRTTVCDSLTDVTRTTWERYATGIPYRRSCP